MKIAIIITIPDFAGLNIKENLLNLDKFVEIKDKFDDYTILEYKKNSNIKIYTTDERCVYCENIDKKINFDSDLIIFPTTHRSEKGTPSLCVHTPGNWAKAELGGQDRKLCIAPGNYLRAAFVKMEELNKKYNLNFDVVQECTHHGPYLEKPVMFLEIGSSEEQWKNKIAGKIIAETILYLITKKIEECNIAFGIGGTHTTTNFKKLIFNNKIALGHVCPKYALEHLDKEMVLQAIEKTWPKNDLIVLDWKGLKTEKERIVKLLEELSLGCKRTKDFS